MFTITQHSIILHGIKFVRMTQRLHPPRSPSSTAPMLTGWLGLNTCFIRTTIAHITKNTIIHYYVTVYICIFTKSISKGREVLKMKIEERVGQKIFKLSASSQMLMNLDWQYSYIKLTFWAVTQNNNKQHSTIFWIYKPVHAGSILWDPVKV